MGRISRLINLVVSGDIDQLKPSGFCQYDGVSADLFRSVVVFLHATLEELVRTLTQRTEKAWSLYSGTDIDKRLTQASIDPQGFKSLYPPLTQLAKRRNRIVHHADFLGSTDTVVQAWEITDYWQLSMWNLAVVCFYYRLIVHIEPGNDAVRTSHDRILQAMSALVDLGNSMVALGKAPAESRMDAVKRMADSLTTVTSTLKSTRITSAIVS
jgi:hypothetical protein